jgi:nicotinate phosphoribosyltransferase
MRLVMEGGKRLPSQVKKLDAIREHRARELARLPSRLRALEPAEPPYPVEVSEGLERYRREVSSRLRSG